MRANPGYYLFGIGGEWEFSEVKLGDEPYEGDLAKGLDIALAEGAAVKVRYVPAEGEMVWKNWDEEEKHNNDYVTFDGDHNAVIAEAGSYDIFVNGAGACYIHPVGFEDLDISVVKFNVSEDGKWLLLVAAFDIGRIDVNGE